METIKLLINDSTFSMIQKINNLESTLKQKSEEHENEYNELKQKSEEQENKYNLELDNIGNTIYFHGYELDVFNKYKLNNYITIHVYSKIIYLQMFANMYTCVQTYQFKSDIYKKSIHYIPHNRNLQSKLVHRNLFKPFYSSRSFCDPFLLISLNVYQKLKLIILENLENFIINVFTNDKMIEGHVNEKINGNTEYIYTQFRSKPIPLFTVEIIVIPLSAFLSYDASLDYETYTNFFKNIVPNLKIIYITINLPNNSIYDKNDFMKTSIEYGINYIINNTSIEKIIFTSYSQIFCLCDSLSTDTIDYLKNIVNNNQTRNIILEINNIITNEELIKKHEL